jgi:hypothetical protein
MYKRGERTMFNNRVLREHIRQKAKQLQINVGTSITTADKSSPDSKESKASPVSATTPTMGAGLRLSPKVHDFRNHIKSVMEHKGTETRVARQNAVEQEVDYDGLTRIFGR